MSSRPVLRKSEAVSIFDQDTLDSMAEVLSNVQNVDRSQPVNADPGSQAVKCTARHALGCML